MKPNRANAALTISIAGALSLGCASAAPAFSRPPATQGGQLEQAVSLYEQGKYAEAESVLSGLEGVEAKAYLSVCLARQQKNAEAEATAKAVLAQSPTQPLALAALGQSLVAQGKHDEAIERLSSAIAAIEDAENKTDAAYAFFWRGQARYRKGGQADKMVADFEVFLKLVPEAPEASSVRQLLAGVR